MSDKLKICIYNCFFSILFINAVLSDEIPIIMWNIKGDSLNIKPVSALGNVDELFVNTLKDVSDDSSSLLVFSVHQLSLEDLSASDKTGASNDTLQNLQRFLDAHPNMMFPSVQNPLHYIHKAHCGVQEIVVDKAVDENVLKSVSSAMDTSCVTILHISEDGVSNKDQIKEVFLPSIENSKKNVVGAFTGAKSSWSMPENDRYPLRNLLQVEESYDKSSIVNVSGCLLMYFENSTFSIGSDNVTLPDSPDTTGSACGNDSVLQLTFKTAGDITSVVLNLNFPTREGTWSVKGSVEVTGGSNPGTYNLDAPTVSAPVGFSYSCGDLYLKVNATPASYFTFQSFQIQPYAVEDGIFSDSFDCVPFFTIPIWMGVVVSLLFIIIINIGVYALFSIRTMDQFDDPKGKTISVALSE
ncbi:V-type proton ATPase subunit S1-like [Uloborus diversus]|uniref:V-type proton ATPase subunit S1-like n=1 Tax=Uloborus diversus TaxID=327109 RepID=UPI0024098569|nr:V-type proton ATPase subunit S1-like [Uloborus diversus]